MANNESKTPRSISDVIDGLDELAEEESEVLFGDMLDKFGSRSFAPVMLTLALVELSPVGTIPGVPSFLAVCIALIAVQLLLGRDHIWVPDWIEERKVSSDKLSGATDKLDSIASKLDSLTKGRLKGLTRGFAQRVAAAIILILCAAVPPLEFLPWAAAGPMLAIAVISLAIMVRDGLAMLMAWALTGVILGFAGYYFMSSGGS